MVQPKLKELLSADDIIEVQLVQELWAGYGNLYRVRFSQNSIERSVIVKWVNRKSDVDHPKSFDSQFAILRKHRSYKIEKYFYHYYSYQLNGFVGIAQEVASIQNEESLLLAIDDLSVKGFTNPVNQTHLNTCLKWLARFHAYFMNDEPLDLWEVGTYWHLETRPDELESMSPGLLKEKAVWLDKALNSAHYKTYVHGDAKFANFLANENGDVAAVDFQYVGGGVGVKDVIYLLSGLGEELNEQLLESSLSFYFKELAIGLDMCGSMVEPAAVEKEWRDLVAIAFADFERFLQGWSPGHWKSTSFVQEQVDKALASFTK